MRDVSFAYPTRPDQLVLNAVSLVVEPGQAVALCGPSGGGKSSIISLIERFYDPSGGAILVDDVPLTSLDASWWRSQVALVAQELLFNGSVDNLHMGAAAAASTRRSRPPPPPTPTSFERLRRRVRDGGR